MRELNQHALRFCAEPWVAVGVDGAEVSMSAGDDHYRPPSADLGEPTAAVGPLYSPGQVAGAAFLGSPIAGCWLLASNFRALGRADAQWRSLWGGLGASVALLALALVLPDDLPSILPTIAYTVALHQVAERLQGSTFREHIAAGGRKHSTWRAVGIGIGWALLLLAAISALVFALPEGLLPDA